MNYLTEHYKSKCEQLNRRKHELLIEKQQLEESFWSYLASLLNRLNVVGRWMWNSSLRKWIWSGPKPADGILPPKPSKETATGYSDEIMAWYDDFMRNPANSDRWSEVNEFGEIMDSYHHNMYHYQQLQEKINLLKQIIAESENPTPTEFQIPKENTPPTGIPPLGVPTDEIIRSIIEIIKKMKNVPKPKPMPEPEIGYGGR
jgi:hypothetical protein